MTEDQMVGWHHQLNGDEFEQAPGDGEGQESLACCSPWGLKVRVSRMVVTGDLWEGEWEISVQTQSFSYTR